MSQVVCLTPEADSVVFLFVNELALTKTNKETNKKLKKIFNVIWEHKKLRMHNTILNNNRTHRNIVILDFKLYYGVIIRRIV